MNVRPKKRVRLGELLTEQALVTPVQLDHALKEQKRSGRKLGRVLTDLGILSENQLNQALASHLQLPYVDLRQASLDPQVVRMLPESHARRFRALVLQSDKRGLLVGMADPSDLFAYDEIAKRLKQPLRVAVVSETELLRMLDVVYRRTDEIASLVQEVRDDLREGDVDLALLTADDTSAEAPVLRLLHSIFSDAVQVNASDIHIEPGEGKLRVRQRVDGVLQEQVLEGSRVASALVTRLKLMAGLDISERRLPQDGRFSIKIGAAHLDVRMSSMPTQNGEGVVLRLLNQAMGLQPLDALGNAAGYRAALSQADSAQRRHRARDRTHGQRQDDHALFRAQHPEQIGHQDHHGRRSGGIPARSNHAGPDQGQDRAGFRPCAALGPAPRSGHHLRRRNARPGDRRHRPACRDHGSFGVLDAAHDERHGDHRSADRHGRTGLHGGGRRTRGGWRSGSCAKFAPIARKPTSPMPTNWRGSPRTPASKAATHMSLKHGAGAAIAT
jgi:hypothetical protein